MSKYKISEVSLAGFRGANQQVVFTPGPGLNVIYGLNGLGKTSLVQAIEWCLFGSLPYLEGQEFQREDAIVNLFRKDSKATVNITLSSENSSLAISRERSRSTSTTRGRTKLSFQNKDGLHHDAQAQNELLRTVQLSQQEFDASVHLHQEAIRALILGDAAERSAAIDRLLGLHDLRTLVANLQVDFVARETRKLEQDKSNLDAQVIRGAIILRSSLEDRKAQILKKGLQEADLTRNGCINLLAELQQATMDIAAILQPGLALPTPESETLTELSRVMAATRNGLAALQNGRTTRMRSLFDEKASIGEPLNKYQLARSALPEDFDSQLLKLSEEHADLDARVKEERVLLDADKKDFMSLEATSRKIGDLEAELGRHQGHTDGILSLYGTEDQLKQHIDHVGNDVESLTRLIEQRGTYEQLLALAVRYLTASHPSSCPICKKPFDGDATSAALEAETAGTEGNILQQLHKKKDGKSSDLTQAREALRQLDALAAAIENKQHELSELAAQIGVVESESQTLAQVAANKAAEAQLAVQAKQVALDQLTTQVRDLENQLRSLENTKSVIERSAVALAQILNVPDGPDLEESANERLKTLDDEIQSIESVGAMFDALPSQAEDVIGYLEQEDQLDRVQSQLPGVNDRIQQLDKATANLHILEASLADIQAAVTGEQERLVKQALEQVIPVAQSNYSLLLGHPVFAELTVDVQEEKKGTFTYWVKAGSPDDSKTFIPTRFSTAQMNVVALSLFLAMFQRFPHQLGFLILDDPSQSMDRPHVEALGSVLANYSKNAQVIVATEDPNLRDALLAAKTPATLVSLADWSTHGIALESRTL